jgi:excisionase family DNA binding protein
MGVEIVTRSHMQGDTDFPRSLIRLSEAAALVGVHPQTLRRWIGQGKVAGWRLASNQIRVDRDELLALAQPIAPANSVAAVAAMPSRQAVS